MFEKSIKDFPPLELENHIVESGEKPYRSRQIAEWIYQK
ncbi:MAG: 23S rRNA (adenine(2503)-C(2))-methyltransferase RlmN, partial [Thermodesulfobacteriota bacterium]